MFTIKPALEPTVGFFLRSQCDWTNHQIGVMKGVNLQPEKILKHTLKLSLKTISDPVTICSNHKKLLANCILAPMYFNIERNASSRQRLQTEDQWKCFLVFIWPSNFIYIALFTMQSAFHQSRMKTENLGPSGCRISAGMRFSAVRRRLRLP